MKVKITFHYKDGGYLYQEAEFHGKPEDFPSFVRYQNTDWEAVLYDTEIGKDGTECSLSYSENVLLPTNLFGVPFSAVRFEDHFIINVIPEGECECGAKFTDFPDNHMQMCKLWRKP